ncbi:MAG: flotillin-like FloA family protein [bacterium]
MAQAFREGKLGVFDYYHLKNIQADTSMRESFSRITPPGEGEQK